MTQTRSPISLPADLAMEVDDRASEHAIPRSTLLVRALGEYLERRRAAELTRQLKDAYADETDNDRAERSAWTQAGRRTVAARLAGDEW